MAVARSRLYLASLISSTPNEEHLSKRTKPRISEADSSSGSDRAVELEETLTQSVEARLWARPVVREFLRVQLDFIEDFNATYSGLRRAAYCYSMTDASYSRRSGGVRAGRLARPPGKTRARPHGVLVTGASNSVTLRLKTKAN